MDIVGPLVSVSSQLSLGLFKFPCLWTLCEKKSSGLNWVAKQEISMLYLFVFYLLPDMKGGRRRVFFSSYRYSDGMERGSQVLLGSPAQKQGGYI